MFISFLQVLTSGKSGPYHKRKSSSGLLLNTSNGGRSSSGSRVVHVSPRVAGHAIHKPKISMQRLGMEEIERLQRGGGGQAEAAREEGGGAQTQDEDEPLAPRHREEEEQQVR